MMIEELQSLPKLEAFYHVLTIAMALALIVWLFLSAVYFTPKFLRRARSGGRVHKGSVLEWEIQNGYRLSDGKPIPPPVRSVRECDEYKESS